MHKLSAFTFALLIALSGLLADTTATAARRIQDQDSEDGRVMTVPGARRRRVRGGKEFGKGMGGFGKHVGKGSGKIGKRVGDATQRALTL